MYYCFLYYYKYIFKALYAGFVIGKNIFNLKLDHYKQLQK